MTIMNWEETYAFQQKNIGYENAIWALFWGDIIGSAFEYVAPATEIELENIHKEYNFGGRKCEFTDDTYLVIAMMNHLLTGRDASECLKSMYYDTRDKRYGSWFQSWCYDWVTPASYGNGSCIRSVPIALYYKNLEDVKNKVIETTKLTHDTEIGLVGALATAEAVFHLKEGKSLEEIKNILISNYDMITFDTPFHELIGKHSDIKATNLLISAIQSVEVSSSSENAIKNAIRIGGDTDTRAAIAGILAALIFKDARELTCKYLCKGSIRYEYFDFAYNDNLMQIVDSFEEYVGKH